MSLLTGFFVCVWVSAVSNQFVLSPQSTARSSFEKSGDPATLEHRYLAFVGSGNVNGEILDGMFAFLDINKDGTIDFDEINKLESIRVLSSREAAGLRAYDVEQAGLTRSELNYGPLFLSLLQDNGLLRSFFEANSFAGTPNEAATFLELESSFPDQSMLTLSLDRDLVPVVAGAATRHAVSGEVVLQEGATQAAELATELQIPTFGMSEALAEDDQTVDLNHPLGDAIPLDRALQDEMREAQNTVNGGRTVRKRDQRFQKRSGRRGRLESSNLELNSEAQQAQQAQQKSRAKNPFNIGGLNANLGGLSFGAGGGIGFGGGVGGVGGGGGHAGLGFNAALGANFDASAGVSGALSAGLSAGASVGVSAGVATAGMTVGPPVLTRVPRLHLSLASAVPTQPPKMKYGIPSAADECCVMCQYTTQIMIRRIYTYLSRGNADPDANLPQMIQVNRALQNMMNGRGIVRVLTEDVLSELCDADYMPELFYPHCTAMWKVLPDMDRLLFYQFGSDSICEEVALCGPESYFSQKTSVHTPSQSKILNQKQ